MDHQEHSFETGEEECLCTFILSWLHGPLAGRMTAENIESICRLQFNVEKDPAVASFLKTVREKIEITGDSNSLSKGEVTSISTANHHGEIPGLNVGHKRIFSQHLKQASYFVYIDLELHHLSYPVVVDDSLSICRIQGVQGSLQMVHGCLNVCTHSFLDYFRCILLPLYVKMVDELVLSLFLSSSCFPGKQG